MKKFFILLLLAFTLNAFEVYDFYSCKKTGEFKFILKQFEDNKINKTDTFSIEVIKFEDTRLIQFKKKDKLSSEFVVDENNVPVSGYTYFKDRKMEIKLENLKKRDEGKLISMKNETINLSGKKYNVTKYTYKDTSSHVLSKGNLILITETETIQDIYKDMDGVPVKIEETKVITQKTKNIMKPDKIINENKRIDKEIVEIF